MLSFFKPAALLVKTCLGRPSVRWLGGNEFVSLSLMQLTFLLFTRPIRNVCCVRLSCRLQALWPSRCWDPKSLSVYSTPPQKKTNQKNCLCPDWCGSVGWASAHKPKGHWYDSRSGHMPGLWARSPVGGIWERQLIDVSLEHCFFSPTLSPSLPLSLKINKIFQKTVYRVHFYRTIMGENTGKNKRFSGSLCHTG